MKGRPKTDHSPQRLPNVPARKRRPWEQQEGEPSVAYHYFLQYRDMGPQRSMRKLAAAMGIKPQRFFKISMLYSWSARCVEYDSFLDSQYVDELAITQRKAARRHAGQSRGIQEFLSLILARLLKEIRTRPELLEDMSKMNLAALLSIAKAHGSLLAPLIQAERLALGMSTENVALAAKVDVNSEQREFETKLRRNPEALQLWNKLQAALEAQDGAPKQVMSSSEEEG